MLDEFDTPDDLLRKYTSQSKFSVSARVISPEPSPPRTWQPIRKEVILSLGALDNIPIELVLSILQLLDLRTLLRLSAVSAGWASIVETLPAFVDMMRFAPEAFATLAKTGLLHHHSVSLLHQALYSDRCASCFAFGGLLSILRCERVCYECMLKNPVMWTMTEADAQECFCLSSEHLKDLPVMNSVHSLHDGTEKAKTEGLVNVGHVKQLAVEMHGSVEEVAKFKPTTQKEVISESQYYQFIRYHEASLEPPVCEISRLPSPDELRRDAYSGMAHMRFPTVTKDGERNMGYLCIGCIRVHFLWTRRFLPPSVIPSFARPGMSNKDAVEALTFKLRSKPEALQHLGHCYGVKWIRQHLGHYHIYGPEYTTYDYEPTQ